MGRDDERGRILDDDDNDRGLSDDQLDLGGSRAADSLFGPFSVRGPGVQIILEGRPISWPNEGK